MGKDTTVGATVLMLALVCQAAVCVGEWQGCPGLLPVVFSRGVMTVTRIRMQSLQAGNVILNSLPVPAALTTSILPPCAMVTARTRLRPSPQPLLLRLSSHLK